MYSSALSVTSPADGLRGHREGVLQPGRVPGLGDARVDQRRLVPAPASAEPLEGLVLQLGGDDRLRRQRGQRRRRRPAAARAPRAAARASMLRVPASACHSAPSAVRRPSAGDRVERVRRREQVVQPADVEQSTAAGPPPRRPAGRGGRGPARPRPPPRGPGRRRRSRAPGWRRRRRATRQVPRQLRPLALDPDVDRGAGVLAGELEELPLPAQQPERVGDRGGQGRLQVGRQRQPFEPGPGVDRRGGARPGRRQRRPLTAMKPAMAQPSPVDMRASRFRRDGRGVRGRRVGQHDRGQHACRATPAGRGRRRGSGPAAAPR